MNRALRHLQPAIAPVALLVLWELWSQVAPGTTRTLLLPPPWRIISAMLGLIADGDWWWRAMRTFGVTILGFGLGSVGAIVSGVALGQSPLVARLINPSLLGLRSLPVVLYVP